MPVLYTILGSVRAVLFLLWLLALYVTQPLVYLIFRNHTFIPRIFHKGCCFILGIKIRGYGEKHAAQTVFLSNHLSWADIPVIGAMTAATFVSKSEVKNWPGLGLAAKTQNTVFIRRVREKSAMAEATKDIVVALDEGRSLIIFPEGTNTVGDKVAPFKSSLLSVVEGMDIAVQPVTIKIHRVGKVFRTNDNEIPQNILEIYTWGEIEFVPHLWRFLCMPRFEVDVHFLPVIETAGLNRKQITKQADDAVRACYHAS